MPTWIVSLRLAKDEKEVIKKLEKEKVELDLLLNPVVSVDHILMVLQHLKFKAGIILKIIGSISQARNDNEAARKESFDIANSVKAKEREISLHHTTLKLESSSLDINKANKKAIFLSYSWANKQIIRRLNDILQQNDCDCWIDDHKMQGGSELFGEIDNGISDCQVFISCCSNSYGSSVNCQRELLLACDRKKLIIPVLVATCDPWPPKGQMGPLLAGKIYIDLSSDEKFEKTVDQLIIAINQSLY